MLISCNSCNSKYLVNSAELKPDGRNVQCANCGNQWFQESQVFEDNAIIRGLNNNDRVLNEPIKGSYSGMEIRFNK